MVTYITKDKELDFKRGSEKDYKVIEPIKTVQVSEGEKIVLYRECNTDTQKLEAFNVGGEEDVNNADN